MGKDLLSIRQRDPDALNSITDIILNHNSISRKKKKGNCEDNQIVNLSIF